MNRRYGCYTAVVDGVKAVPTVAMGRGTVSVSALTMKGDSGQAVVVFGNSSEGLPPGDQLIAATDDTTFWEGVEVMLTFDNPASIDVVIRCLEKAKRSLERDDG